MVVYISYYTCTQYVEHSGVIRTTKVVSLNLAHGEMYLMQHYVIKFVTIRWFSPVSSNNKTDGHDITDIFLKVVLNTIIPRAPDLVEHSSVHNSNKKI